MYFKISLVRDILNLFSRVSLSLLSTEHSSLYFAKSKIVSFLLADLCQPNYIISRHFTALQTFTTKKLAVTGVEKIHEVNICPLLKL